MPGSARKDLIDIDRIGTYHCWSRCVRRVPLCGFDPETGRNYDYRKTWLENRTELLASVFALDVLTFSVLDNHIHHTIRTRPDIAFAWTDEEVARRWWRLHPNRKRRDGTPEEMTEDDLRRWLSNTDRMRELRKRLRDPSWFMKLLKEPIAKWANREDGVTGHFWEGRFNSTEILDESGLIATSVYVDLNWVRAGMALTPEESLHSSVYRRILARQLRLTGGSGRAPDSWLAPIPEEGEPGNCAAPEYRASDKGFLPMSVDAYLQLVDLTGREVRPGKRGAIPSDLKPILERLAINSERWLQAIANYPRLFRKAIGRPASMQEAARRRGQLWLHGSRACRSLFN